MKPRSIVEVIDSMRARLASLASPMANFSNYSNIYALFRTIASTLTEQDVRLNQMVDSSFISTATGSSLDRIASDYGISRAMGKRARGAVLVSGPSVNIPKGLVLSIASQGIQVETDTALLTTSGSEVSIPVTAVSPGLEGNIEAGTLLYSALYPTNSFVVGRYRERPSNAIIGSLSGGRRPETDEQLRSRIRNRSRVVGTVESIRESLSSLEGISRVHIQEHSPTTGHFTIYLDTLDAAYQLEVYNLVSSIKPLGTSFVVRPIKLVPTNISIEVSAEGNTSEIVNEARSLVYSYVDGLELGESLQPNQLGSYILSNSLFTRLVVKLPLSEVVVDRDTAISVSSVEVSIR